MVEVVADWMGVGSCCSIILVCKTGNVKLLDTNSGHGDKACNLCHLYHHNNYFYLTFAEKESLISFSIIFSSLVSRNTLTVELSHQI